MPKKSITLPIHVLKVVEQEVKKNYGGSLSNYILELIKKDKQEEIDKEYFEMPIKYSEVIHANLENKCRYCGKPIRLGTNICNAKFRDGHEQYVHEKCCKE